MQLNNRKKRSLNDFAESLNNDLPTYIIVHGWKSATSSDTVQNIKNNYLKTRDCNVIGKCVNKSLNRCISINIFAFV